MARNVVLNLIGNNRTAAAFRGAARGADDAADRVDRLGDSAGDTSGRLGLLGRSSDQAGGRLAALRGRTATLVSALLAVGPAALPAGAAVVAAAGSMAAAFGSAAAAAGAFKLAVGPQLEGISEAAKLAEKAQQAQAQGGKAAAEANKQYAAALAGLPPATRETAKAFIGLKADYKAWSDSLSGDTMPIFTRGLNVARGLLPKLTPLVKTAAGALGDFMKEIERGTKSKGFAGFLGRINEAAKKTLPALLRSAKNVGVGLAGIFDAFLPHAGAMATGIEGLTEKFAKWGQSLRESDSFKQFISYVRANLPALQTTFSNLVQIVVNLGAAFAPMSGVSLQLIKNFTGILAALPPPVLTALATGFIAVTTAIRILTPVMRVLNFVMRLNPIGIVVLALAGLVAGLIYAYRHSETFRRIVDKAWAGVKSAVVTAWTKWIRPALQAFAGQIKKAYEGWQKWWPKLKELLDQVVGFFKNDLLGVVNDIAGAFGKVGDKAGEAGEKISGVGSGMKSTQDDGNKFIGWSNLFGAALGAALLGPFGTTVGYVTTTFWPEMKSGFKEGFTTLTTNAETFAVWFTGRLKNGFTSVATNARTIFGSQLPGAVSRGLGLATSNVKTGLGQVKKTFFDGLPPLRLSWSSLWNWVKAFAGRLLDQTETGVHNVIRAIRNAFSTGVAGIKASWSKLDDGVKIPVNWIINVAYNKGIRNLWNSVMEWLHLPGGLRLGKIPALEKGGTLDNPAPASPMMVNRPTAIVGEGSRKFPEFVIPTDPKYRDRAQALWAAAGGRLQMLAKGGVLGSVLGAVKKIAGKVTGIGKAGMDLLANPRGVWDRMVRQMVPDAGHLAVDKWGTAMSKVVPALLGRAWQAASPLISTFKKWFGGDASGVVRAAASMIGRGDDQGENNNWLTRMWGMPGAPWCAIFVSEAIKQAHATKKYRGYPSAAVASYVGAMRHVGRTEGRPGDLGAYRGTGHINVIARNLGGGLYETIGGNEGPRVKRSRRGGQSAILRPMASGGVLGIYQQRNLDPADGRDPLLRALRGGLRVATFDDGGMLMPGATLAFNHTGRPEPVHTSHEEAAAAYGGPLVGVVNVNHVPGYSTPEDIFRGMRHGERAARFHRRGS